MKSGDQSVTLELGDTVAYCADIPHAITNSGRKPTVVFLVDAHD